jgi:hypothetical protein
MQLQGDKGRVTTSARVQEGWSGRRKRGMSSNHRFLANSNCRQNQMPFPNETQIWNQIERAMKTKMTTTTTTNKETQSVLVVETKATRRRINMSLVTIGRRIQGCVDRLWRNRDTSKYPWCRPHKMEFRRCRKGASFYIIDSTCLHCCCNLRSCKKV